MKTLLKTLDVIHEAITKRDYDEVLCISGDEGRGKTTLALHIVEYWLNKQYGHVTSVMATKHIALDSPGFARVLEKVAQFDIALHDEAADLSARGAMKKQNQLYVQAYQIIRGDNLFTILIIPSIFDLDSFFRKRRVRHLINVHARGRLAFWSQSRLRKMVQINERLPYKNIMITKPTFYDTYPKYDGVLNEEYQRMKKEKMKKVRRELAVAMKGITGTDLQLSKHAEVVDLHKQGRKRKEIAELVGYTPARISQIVRQYT